MRELIVIGSVIFYFLRLPLIFIMWAIWCPLDWLLDAHRESTDSMDKRIDELKRTK